MKSLKQLILTSGAFLALATEALAAEGGGGLLSPNPGLAIWTLITFFTVLVLLRLFAWNPLMEALDQRSQRIEDMIKEAENKFAQAEELVKEYEDKLEDAKKEAMEIVEEGKKDAEKVGARLKEEAREEAEKLKKQSKKEIELAKKKAQDEIWELAVEISTSLAEKIMEKSLRSKDDQNLIDSALKEYRKN